MSNKQKIAIISPLILIGMMYPIFQLLVGIFGDRIGWYLGLVTYWVIWGGLFPLLIIGKTSIHQLIRPQKLDIKILLLVLFPLLMAGLYRIFTGIEYDKPSTLVFILVLSTNLGNGFFEEVLWRGVYMELFPDRIMYRIIWPSIWFALWHYTPGSVSPSGNAFVLIIGSGLMGFYLAFLAKKTETIWWNIIAHTLGGFIMVI